MINEKILNKYCSECEHLADFEKITILEKVKVKNSIIENEHLYYKCSHCDELFEPFDDPDYNAKLDFDKYKQLNGLLLSEEVKEVRSMYNLTLRQMAELVGVSYSTLSEIENGSIQSKVLNNILLAFKDPFAVRNVFKERKEFLRENFDGFKLTLDNMCSTDEKNLSELKGELSLLRDQAHYMLRRVNVLGYDIGNSEEVASPKSKNGEMKWKVQITNIMARR